MKGELTAKQARFVEEYLIDRNGKQAAIRAGYSAKTAEQGAGQLLRNIKVKAEIAKRTKALSAKLQIVPEDVVRDLIEVKERCMQRAPVMVRDGRKLVQMQDDDGHHVWEFDSRGAIAALQLLGRHLGMFADKVEHSGKDGSAFEVIVRHVHPGD